MKKILEWSLLILLAAAGVFSWYKLSLPRFQSINLSVGQNKAIDTAKAYLMNQRHVDLRGYNVAVMFNVDEGTDRYMQRTLGNAAYQKLMERLHYDLFCWVVRFFKEKQKEEYKIAVGSATGEIIGFTHTIEDTAARPDIDKDKARQIAFDFLVSTYHFNPSDYIIHGENVHRFDKRQEYSFSWQKKDVEIPWSKAKDQGNAKLLTAVTISGPEILKFNKDFFEIPDGFNRFIDNLKQTGENLILVFRILYLALITIAIVVVVNRKHQVVNRSVKFFYVGVGVAMFILMALDVLNSYQDLLFDYPTTQSLGDYIGRQIIEGFIGPFFIAVGFVLPAMAGESLRYETTPRAKNRGFLHAVMSSFGTVNIARQIFVGYLAAVIILGSQAVIFNLGFKYCGVWDELSWLTQNSTTVFPALTAIMIGFQAAFSEESMFRMFAINLFKKYGVPTALAVFFSAAMWGFGHTGYEIFPMWFRGLEVTSIGIIMGIFYLRYGIMCVITAHFLIDSFLTGLPYLLKFHPSVDSYSALGVVMLPFVLGLIALLLNRSEQEKPLKVKFNAQQQFNYELLRGTYRSKNPSELGAFRKELERHGWDAAIIERVFEDKE